MIIKELFARLGLQVDVGEFLKAGGLLEGLRLGYDKLIEKVGELAGEFVTQIRETAEAGEAIEHLAQVTGTTTDSVQDLTSAANSSGVSTDQFAQSIGILSRNMLAAKEGAEEQRKAFKKIGVAYKDGTGKLRGADEVLKDLADKFKAMPEGAEKTALAMRALGRSGADMLPFLNLGSGGIEAIAKQSQNMTEDQIAASKELVIAQKQLGAVTSSIWKSAIYPLIPAIRDLVKQWVMWVKANGAMIKQGIGKFIGVLLIAVKGLSKALAAMVAMLKLVSEHWRLFAILLGTVVLTALLNSEVAVDGLIAKYITLGFESVAAAAKSAAAWVAANATTVLAAGGIALGIAGIVAVVDDMSRAIKGQDSLTGDSIASWKKWFEVFDKRFPALHQGWDRFNDTIKSVYDWIVSINEAVERKMLPLLRIVGEVARKIGVTAQASSNAVVARTGGAIANPYMGAGEQVTGLLGAVRAANAAATMTMASRQLAEPKLQAFATEQGGKTVLHVAAPSLNYVSNIAVQPGQSLDEAAEIAHQKFLGWYHEQTNRVMEDAAGAVPATE